MWLIHNDYRKGADEAALEFFLLGRGLALRLVGFVHDLFRLEIVLVADVA